jgi:hypothetical protein
VTITAIKSGDSVYADAQATASITVGKASATVTLDDATAFYDASAHALTATTLPANLTLTYRYAGTGATTYGPSTAAPTAPGAYSVTASVSDANYAGSATAALTIVIPSSVQDVIDLLHALPNPVKTWNDADTVAVATRAYTMLAADEQALAPRSAQDALTTAQQESGPVNHADPTPGHQGHADSPALPWHVRLIITPIAPADARYAPFTQLPGQRPLGVNDVALVDTLTGQPWQPPAGATVDVTLLDVNLDGLSGISVVHEQADGSLETVSSSVSDGVVTFTGASFSPYGVLGIKAIALVATPVPALDRWGLVALTLLLAVMGWRSAMAGRQLSRSITATIGGMKNRDVPHGTWRRWGSAVAMAGLVPSGMLALPQTAHADASASWPWVAPASLAGDGGTLTLTNPANRCGH